jgi:predicted NAD-dependent protein-ADP-ribosyltransferase YbiA (DUF1768 family)
MVVSNIIRNVKFNEDRSVEIHDKNTEVAIFRITLFNIDVNVSIGKVNTSLYNDIYFAPAYLVLNENVQIKIGIYEFLAEDYTTLLDDDNDLNIAYIDGPLLFNSVTLEYLQEMNDKYELLQDILSDEEYESEDEDEDEPDANTMRAFVYEEDDEMYLELNETKTDNDEIMKIFNSNTNTSWVEDFYKNNNYSVLDNEGGGDCLFAAIRDGLKYSNISVTVPEIRKMLSEATTQDQYVTYKENYDMLKSENNALSEKMGETRKKFGELSKEYKKIANDAKQETDRDNKLILKDKALTIKDQIEAIRPVFKKYKEDQQTTEANLVEFQFMENIESLEDLKKMMNTCKFWADAASITRIENIMNIKLIILSSEYYKMGLKERVVTCGDFTLKEIEDKGYFNPKYYIMLDHTGDHYKLIKYKEKGAILFNELPYKLREDIIEQCASSNGKTIYNYIPKFQTYMGIPSTMPTKDDDMEEITSDNEAEMTPTASNDIETPLFDDSVILQFYSKSKHVAPGKGSGENISPNIESDYLQLNNVRNWRRQLSNFHTKIDKDNNIVPLFKLDGYSWASVEHYYHANKFKENNMDYYKLFTMESKSEISKDPIAAKGAGGKTGKVNKKKFRPSNIKMDNDFMLNNKNQDVMYNGQLAKYKQNPDLKQMLLFTNNAKLVHFSRGGSIVFYDTMKVRTLIQNETGK